MTRNEAEAEIRRLMDRLRMSERQIEAFGVLLGEIPETPTSCCACGGSGYSQHADGVSTCECQRG